MGRRRTWRTWRPVRLPAPLRHSELVEESRLAARFAQGKPWRLFGPEMAACLTDNLTNTRLIGTIEP